MTAPMSSTYKIHAQLEHSVGTKLKDLQTGQWEVSLDAAKCAGHACCVMAAPGVFRLDERTGKAVVIQPFPSGQLGDDVEAAVRECPTRAISIRIQSKD